MATINKRATNIDMKEITVNYEGAVAYKLPAKARLVSRVAGAFWSEDTFYVSGKALAEDIRADIQKVAKVDPKFVLQLAAYARNVLNLRTTPQVLLVEAANIVACKPFVREYTPKIVKRADEVTDVLAYHINQYGGPNKNHNKIPNSLKKGLAEACTKFDEYQLNKYASSTNEISMKDALLLIDRHKDYPVSKALYNYLVNDILDEEALPRIANTKKILAASNIEEIKDLIPNSVITWEMFISKFKASKESWEAVIPKMGYMAKLRNLRNFIEQNVDLTDVLQEIADPEAVKKSKQLPFRFYSAYKEIPAKNTAVIRALSKALDNSVSNVPLTGTSAIAVDLSGSMNSPLSAKSKVTLAEVGCVLGAMAFRKAEESVVIGFGSEARTAKLNPTDSILTNLEKIRKMDVGYATEAHKLFDKLGNTIVDRIIIISDMQCYGGYGDAVLRNKYKAYQKINPNVKLYSFNIAPYGTSQFAQSDNVTQINGWSDKIIDYISLTENKDVMESEIKKW